MCSKNLDKCFSLLPSEPKAFYLRPLSSVPMIAGKSWFINDPIGINTFKNVLPNMSKKAGLGTVYTNHSLRATSTSMMYTHDIPEKVIAETTGHRSLAGLRAYEHTTTLQKKAVTKTLVDPHQTTSGSENIPPNGDNHDISTSTAKKAVPLLSGSL